MGAISALEERDRLAAQIPENEAETARELLDEEIVSVEALAMRWHVSLKRPFMKPFYKMLARMGFSPGRAGG